MYFSVITDNEILLSGVLCLVAGLIGWFLVYVARQKEKKAGTMEPELPPIPWAPVPAHLQKEIKHEAWCIFTFKPDQELQDFASNFCENCRTVEPGLYVSDNKKYELLYILMRGATTTCRVSKILYKVELSYDKIALQDNYHKDFVYYLIMWCFCLIRLKSKYKDTMPEYAVLYLADYHTMSYYLSTDRVRSVIIDGHAKQFELNPSTENNYRLEQLGNIISWIDKYSSKKPHR